MIQQAAVVKRKPGNPQGKGGFKKGQSGNPLGRPRIPNPITECLRDQAAEIIDFKLETGEIIKLTRAEIAARQAWARACSGDVAVFLQICERIEPMKRIIELNQGVDIAAAIINVFQQSSGVKNGD